MINVGVAKSGNTPPKPSAIKNSAANRKNVRWKTFLSIRLINNRAQIAPATIVNPENIVKIKALLMF